MNSFSPSRRTMLVMFATLGLARCAGQKPATPDSYAVFFEPGTAKLTAEAETIVRRAAEDAKAARAARLDIAIPPDAPGGVVLAEERFSAIQNILSASGVAAGVLQRTSLSDAQAKVPGAANRAEITFQKSR